MEADETQVSVVKSIVMKSMNEKREYIEDGALRMR